METENKIPAVFFKTFVGSAASGEAATHRPADTIQQGDTWRWCWAGGGGSEPIVDAFDKAEREGVSSSKLLDEVEGLVTRHRPRLYSRRKVHPDTCGGGGGGLIERGCLLVEGERGMTKKSERGRGVTTTNQRCDQLLREKGVTQDTAVLSDNCNFCHAERVSEEAHQE